MPRPTFRISSRNVGYTLAAVILTVIVVFLILRPPAEWEQASQWGEWVHANGVWGALATVGIGALWTAVGLPRQLVAFVAGFAFGVVPGLLLSLTGALVGCALTFSVSRRWLRGWVQGRYPTTVSTLDRLLARDTFLKVLVLRLQPLGTNFLTNLCAGLIDVSARVFLLASAVGYVPQMLVFCLAGSGVRVGSTAQLALSGVLLIVALLMGWWLYRRHLKYAS